MRTVAWTKSDSRASAKKVMPLVSAPSTKFDIEFWLVLGMLLLTTVFPAISKYRSYDPNVILTNPAAQFTWSLMYLAAGIRLFTLRGRALPIIKRTPTLWILLAYFVLSIGWSVLAATTLTNSIELIGTTVIALYIVVRFTLRESLEILTLNFGIVGFASLAMVFGAPGHGRMDWGSGPWMGIFQDKNTLAAAMALGILSTLPLIVEGLRRKRVFSLCVFALCLTLLVGSHSATAAIAVISAIGVALVALILRSEKLTTASRAAIVGAIAFVVGTMWALNLTLSNFLAMVGRSPNLTGRTDFWPYLWQAISDRPFLGFGFDAFFRSATGAQYLSNYVVQAGGWTPYHSHNSFIQALIDGGIVALGLLVITLVVALWRAVKYTARSKEKISVWPLAIVVYLIIGSFTETYLDQVNTFEMILFVAALMYPLRAWAITEESMASRGLRPKS